MKAKSPEVADDGNIMDNLLKEIRSGTTLKSSGRKGTVRRKGSNLSSSELGKLNNMVRSSSRRSRRSSRSPSKSPREVSGEFVFPEDGAETKSLKKLLSMESIAEHFVMPASPTRSTEATATTDATPKDAATTPGSVVATPPAVIETAPTPEHKRPHQPPQKPAKQGGGVASGEATPNITATPNTAAVPEGASAMSPPTTNDMMSQESPLPPTNQIPRHQQHSTPTAGVAAPHSTTATSPAPMATSPMRGEPSPVPNHIQSSNVPTQPHALVTPIITTPPVPDESALSPIHQNGHSKPGTAGGALSSSASEAGSPHVSMDWQSHVIGWADRAAILLGINHISPPPYSGPSP